jgi:type III secretory pathway component EscT
LFLGTGEKPKFLPFLAGAAAGTILDKLSGKTNTVSANDDNEIDGKFEFDLIFQYFINEMIISFIFRN